MEDVPTEEILSSRYELLRKLDEKRVRDAYVTVLKFNVVFPRMLDSWRGESARGTVRLSTCLLTT